MAPTQPFLNAVVRLTIGDAPAALMQQLLKLEAEMGRTIDQRRQGSEPYRARVIDLDIIDFDGQRLDEPTLQLPHPRAHQRRFVLVPLNELAPDFQFPDRDESLDTLIRRAPANPMKRLGRLV